MRAELNRLPDNKLRLVVTAESELEGIALDAWMEQQGDTVEWGSLVVRAR